MANISTNVELADDIYQWSRGVVDLLERVMMHLKYAKSHIGTLMDITKQGRTIK